MEDARRKVRIGAAAGMVAFYGALALLDRCWPRAGMVPPGDAAARLAIAARLALWPAALIFVLTALIGRGRIRRGFTNPLAGPGDRALETDRRVLANTVEQGFVFVVALAALAARLPPARLHLLPILTLCFMAGRIAFWIGYRRLPEHRAAGMAITFNVNLVALVLAAVAPWLG